MSSSWRFYLKRLFILGFLILCRFPLQVALAQAINITAPEGKEVTPGDFVTLVFRLEASQDTSIEASVTSALGWEIFRQPGVVELSANQPKPIALTISVPDTAPAAAIETLTLQVANEAPITIELKVKERRDLTLQTPINLVLGQDDLTALLSNNGNVTDKVTLELQYSGESVEKRELSLEPLSEQEQIFKIENEGLYLVQLTSEEGLELTKAVNVIRFGVPEPKPFFLVGDAGANVDTNLEWGTALALGGSLSDVWTLDSYLEAPRWRRSFATLDSSRWGVRLGESLRRPFRLIFPIPFGLSGRTSFEGASLFGSLGYIRSDEWGGYIVSAINIETSRVAVGAGVSSGKPIFGASYEFKYPDTELGIALSFLEGGFDAEAEVRTFNLPGEVTATTEFTNLLKDNAAFSVRGSYNVDTFFAYLGATLALGKETKNDWLMGLSDIIPADLPGDLGFGVQLGSFASFGNIRYFANLGNGWQASNQVGVSYTKQGFGVTLDSHWSTQQQNYLSVDGQFVFYFDHPLEGSLGASLEVPFDILRVYGETAWDIDEQSVGIVAGVLWNQDPSESRDSFGNQSSFGGQDGFGNQDTFGQQDTSTNIWALELSGDVTYTYNGTDAPINAQLKLTGHYLFALEVPEPLVETLGGRNLGRLAGVIRAGNTPVPNVQLEVSLENQSRYKLLSDDTGAFSANLPPGDYNIKLDTGTLPITFRLISEPETSVTLERQHESQLIFEAVATAALSGRVLEDANADGVADDPPKGVLAQLVLTDSEGLKRNVRTAEDGTFLVRGLLPGQTRIKLTGLALGSKVVGDDTLELSLEAGKITDVSFTAQPAIAISQTFSETDLRLRRITPEVDKVPPGTAPLITVTVQGEAERVSLQSEAGTYDLILDGKAWTGRLPIPVTAPLGVYAFTVAAQKGNGQTTKKGQVVLEAEAPAIEVVAQSPVKPGKEMKLELTSYFSIDKVDVQNDLGLTFETIETADGKQVLAATIPENTEDKIYTLKVTVTSTDGQTFAQDATFRVLVP
jgi:hypothetical protein